MKSNSSLPKAPSATVSALARSSAAVSLSKNPFHAGSLTR